MMKNPITRHVNRTKSQSRDHRVLIASIPKENFSNYPVFQHP